MGTLKKKKELNDRWLGRQLCTLKYHNFKIGHDTC